MGRLTRVMVIGGLTALFAGSCVSSSKMNQDRQAAVSQGTPWVRDAQVRAVMLDLAREITTCWPQEDEYAAAGPAKAARKLEDACWLAEGLARAAERIPEAVAGLEMTEPDRRVFLAKAEVLQRQATELQDEACAGDIDRMGRVLTTVMRTCCSCHERFRDPCGP